MQSLVNSKVNNQMCVDGIEDSSSEEKTVKGYIKELIIENFKSYKGRHIIGPFSESLTCIVGPNGSGKSNLMDALSFALGLSSNDMRSSNLKDLIYRPEEGRQISEKEMQGSPTNDIQSQTSLKSENAEVLLIFVLLNQNHEIKFCRRIIYTGTSRFMVNDEVVSQESYFKKLSEFNVLVKARNFLVFQGDVEDIAQRAPRELTNLFEQISGSDAFVEEYDRLSNEQFVNQIISHNTFNRRKLLETEKRELQKQMEEVNEYEKLIEQKLEIQTQQMLFKLYCNEISGGKLFEERQSIDNELTLLNREIEIAKQKIKEEESRIAKENLEWKRLNTELEVLEQDEIKKKDETLELENNIQHYKSEIKKKNKQKEQMFYFKQKNEKLLEEYGKQLEIIKGELKDLGDVPSCSEFLKLISSDVQEYIECKKQADIANSSLREQLLQIEREKANKSGFIEILEKEKNEIWKQTITNKSLLDNLAMKMNEQNEKLRASLEEELALNSQIKQLSDSFSETTNKINVLTKQRSVCDERLKNIDARKGEVQKELELRKVIEDLKDEINKSNNGIEENFVFGRLSDMCHSNNKQFSSVLDSALGKYGDYVIVNNWETAKSCISWLKKNKKEPMDFLPLDSNYLKKRGDSEFDVSLRTLCTANKSFRSLAKDNIHVSDERVLSVLNFCLKGVIFTHSLEDAREIFYNEAPKLGITPKVITLDGEKIMKNGNLSLDFTHRINSKNFAKEYATLSTKIEALNEQISNLEELELNGQRKLSRLYDNMQRLKLHKSAVELKIGIYENNINEKKNSLELLEKKFGEKDLELKTQLFEYENLNSEIENIRNKIYEFEQIHFEKLSKKLDIDDISLLEQNSRKKHEEILQKKNKLSSRLNVIQEEFEEFLSKKELMNKNIKDKETEIINLDESILNENKRLDDLKKDLIQIRINIDQMKSSLKSTNGSKKDFQKELDLKKKSLLELQESYTKKTSEKNSKSEELEILNSELILLLKNIVLENIEIPLLSGGYEDIKKYWEYFELNKNKETEVDEIDPPVIQIDYSSLSEEQKSFSSSSLRVGEEISHFSRSITEITEKIESLNPNMKAKDKIKEIDAQLDALLQDQREIRKKSMEIDKNFKALRKRRTETFMKCFEAVKKAVGKFYSQLTCEGENIGGQAFLDLDDTNLEEPFACGVIFHAMPPSKRFRDIRQLSGGEKTMAALALLFAMQSYHPSPFFVLDEVDAALDPRNVQSIANFLKKASFQSIVISLKDRLFSQADTLIGVYKDRDMKTSAIMTLNLAKYSKINSSSVNRKESFFVNSTLSSKDIDHDIFERSSLISEKNLEEIESAFHDKIHSGSIRRRVEII